MASFFILSKTFTQIQTRPCRTITEKIVSFFLTYSIEWALLQFDKLITVRHKNLLIWLYRGMIIYRTLDRLNDGLQFIDSYKAYN